MSKIDCNVTENFLKEWHRMCDSGRCSECPIGQLADDRAIGVCRHTMFQYSTEVIAAVQKWSDEHPVKSVLEDFLEKYPKAELKGSGTPRACAYELGYREYCYKGESCVECWNRPLSEVQK